MSSLPLSTATIACTAEAICKSQDLCTRSARARDCLHDADSGCDRDDLPECLLCPLLPPRYSLRRLRSGQFSVRKIVTYRLIASWRWRSARTARCGPVPKAAWRGS